MLQSLTSEAQQVIASSQLGRPTAAYRAKFAIKKAIAVAFLFAIGLGILAAAILESSSMLLSTMIAVVITGVLVLALPLWIVVDAVRSRDIQVYVCPAGLLYLHSGKNEAIRWDQVESFWRKVVKTSSYGFQTGTTHRYTLRRYDGATFKFNDNINNVEALGNTIAAETARTLWPRYVAAYQAGQTLTFGKISLNQQGVNYGKDVLFWQQLSPIQIQRGYLTLKKVGDRQSYRKVILAAEIPNVDVLMALVNDIQSGKRS
ncbi:MAG TPA: DUF6585 family protein [Ktedonobacteraceae bacterium]|nr:DUF6585 family protein [Ktedonobacteraceae bacterium]